MSSKICPTTCGQLSTAAVFISIGVVQLLAGIILLKSEYVYLLAGIDFLAAISNASVGSFLGITSSLWENKPKHVTRKSIARQNILAGLYISVMVVNATTAIVMIMGDGNRLLTIPENVDRSDSTVFVLEIMACAYVTSVCSPIVCIVVALVCLSGNRIQIQENMKERESIAKADSYGWVFCNNHGTGPKKLSDIIHSPLNRNSSSSDDVFMDKKCYMSKNSFLKKFSKKSHSRNSISSLRELQSPLRIWDHKRKKILQEITEPNKVFFSDDYLQFPDFNYGSYMETILPRIKQTSLIYPRSSGNTVSGTGPVKEKNKTNPSRQSQPDEVDTKLAHRSEKIKSIKSYEDKIFRNSPTQLSEEVTDSMKRYYSLQYKNEKCHKNSNGGDCIRPMAPNRYANSSNNFSDRNHRSDSAFVNESENQNSTFVQSSSQIDAENKQEIQNSIKPSFIAIKSEAIDELKSKFNGINFNEATEIGDRKDFMKSFKSLKRERFKECDSDAEHKSDFVQNSPEKISSENAELNDIQKNTSWAGEIVPIAVRSTKICLENSIPVSAVTSRISECPSTSESLNSSDFLKESLRNSNIYEKMTESPELPPTATTLYDKIDKLEQLRNLDLHPNKISLTTESEKRKNVVRGRSILGSIPESLAEAIPEHSAVDHEIFDTKKGSTEFKLSRANTCKTTTTTTTTIPKRRGLKSTQSTHLLKRLWSSVGNDDKTDISNLVMDVDSLVGLSDEELMHRTSRLREIRKSVILRSKNEG